ncbi:unnamed protein product [Pleuronectes platessa]|uniref:Uncharacterized protein n=1 Tax=Pleuronectes platessa TaxID=8262 RepID=A0A9N7VI41_PLEPL|nr:unnamed protein product [Pleuronectes platessa]
MEGTRTEKPCEEAALAPSPVRRAAHILSFKGLKHLSLTESRLQQEVSDWCSCGNCANMPTERECVCCREITLYLKHPYKLK